MHCVGIIMKNKKNYGLTLYCMADRGHRDVVPASKSIFLAPHLLYFPAVLMTTCSYLIQALMAEEKKSHPPSLFYLLGMGGAPFGTQVFNYETDVREHKGLPFKLKF